MIGKMTSEGEYIGFASLRLKLICHRVRTGTAFGKSWVCTRGDAADAG